MAKSTVPVNFKDDIMNSSMGGKRRYKMINNSDGTISFEDATTYDQVGSNFGAAQLNATNKAVNAAADAGKIIDDLDAINNVTKEGYIAGALALKQVNNSLGEQPQFVYDESGKITGYKTKTGGADTVFPFSSSSYEVITKNIGTHTLDKDYKYIFIFFVHADNYNGYLELIQISTNTGTLLPLSEGNINLSSSDGVMHAFHKAVCIESPKKGGSFTATSSAGFGKHVIVIGIN